MTQARGLPRQDAAEYLGISPSLFTMLVNESRLPAPRMINSKKIWDRRDLDEYFESLPIDGAANNDDHNPWDDD